MYTHVHISVYAISSGGKKTKEISHVHAIACMNIDTYTHRYI